MGRGYTRRTSKEEIFTRTVSKRGGSYQVTIPAELAKKYNLEDGQMVLFLPEGQRTRSGHWRLSMTLGPKKEELEGFYSKHTQYEFPELVRGLAQKKEVNIV